ncbi:hypothetical protein AVEN_82827-1 [Araneus ventricosus]|uniref:Endonuclease/exonuclease/phosphatase domain-containing protein n=1 Tax=Araneus ventricosus TaxID=182803 RepID=A0A4Y2F7E0_ARAVE|nr:hypothetical protein AVEN_82827-1 [Araneus ventricosus]
MAILISWNCCGFSNKLFQIKDFINEFHLVCMAFQETYLKPGDQTEIKHYCLVRRDGNSGRASGRVVRLVSHEHPSSILQAVAIRIAVPRLVAEPKFYSGHGAVPRSQCCN